MKIGDFLAWWAAQLRDALPGPVRAFWRRRSTDLTLSIAGDTALLEGSGTDATIARRLPKPDRMRPSVGMTRFIATLPSPPRRLRVLLPPGDFIVRRLSLPHAALPHLAEAVRYQLPRLTPCFITSSTRWRLLQYG